MKLSVFAVVLALLPACATVQSDSSPAPESVGESSAPLCEDDLTACETDLAICASDCDADLAALGLAYNAQREADVASALALCDDSSVTAAEIVNAPIGQDQNFPAWMAPGPTGTFFATAAVVMPDGVTAVNITGAFAVESLPPPWN